MPVLENKIILVLSPQSWGNMFISKHHYAIALAEKGNTVYFLNPPGDPSPAERVLIKPSGIHERLYIVEHRLFFPYRLKFHALPVFHWLMQWHIKKLLKKLGKPDIVWSFDIGYLYPFRLFPAGSIKIFHPVDEPSAPISIRAAEGAGIVFSVTQEILDKYEHLPVPRHFINHGLAREFQSRSEAARLTGDPLRVGFSGNLLRKDIDRDTFIQIIEENPAVLFECWGSYRLQDSNIGGGADEPQRLFIERLRAQKNVVLHGPVPVVKLAAELNRMDAFLICYDVERDQSKGTNYHKIMEYLSTGKVIISNNVTTYHGREDLVQMIPGRDSNHALPALFTKVMNNLAAFNSPQSCRIRQEYAFTNSYNNQVERIEKILEEEF